MKCASCKYGEMEEGTTTYFEKLKNCYVIIENVPCIRCKQCGEEYFTNETAEKLDDILDQLKKIASKILIMDYRQAA